MATNNILGISINEIMASPSGAAPDVNDDTFVDPEDEYVELYNQTGSAVNLNDWEIWEGANLRHVFGLTDEIPAMGRFTIVDSTDDANPINNVSGAADYSNTSTMGIGTGDAIGLYSPVTNTFIVVSLDPGGAPGLVASMTTNIQSAHPGASQAHPTEISNADVSGQSNQRVTDGSDTWISKAATAGDPNCFAPDTQIATDFGEAAVQSLQAGDLVRTVDGGLTHVKWVGRQTVRKLLAGPRMQPVRFSAGALGDGLPRSDLTVTADHGMVIDGMVINASALVNGSSIDWVPMAELPDRVTYYHVETENHDVILANGAPAETFVDTQGRMAFDNYAEYLDLYGAERIIPEMDRPRISSRRLLPDAIKARLGIVDEVIDFNMSLSA